MDVGVGAAIGIAIFAVLIVLANRFNASEIRRTRRKSTRELLERVFGNVRGTPDVLVVHHDGRELRVEVTFDESFRPQETTVTCEAARGRLPAFATEHGQLSTHLMIAGVLDDRVAVVLRLFREPTLDCSCDGTRLRIRSAERLVVPCIQLAAALARVGERAEARVALAWGTALDAELSRELVGETVRIAIDGGFRAVLRTVPPAGLDRGPMSLTEALAALRHHPRAEELDVLASGLTGTIEAHDETMTLTMPLTSGTDEVERGALLLARMAGPRAESGVFR